MKYPACILYFVLSFVLIAVSAVAQEQQITIFAVGDSITWGAAFGSGHDYPRVLQRMLQDKGVENLRVTNYGVSGYTVGDILETWQSSSKDRIFQRMDVHFVTIMLGTNDTRVGDETPLDEYLESMNALIGRFQAVTNSDGSHPQVILSLIPPHNSPQEGEHMADNFKDRFIHRDRIPNELNPALLEIGQTRGILVVDNYTPLKEAGPDILPDGLHPAEEGNAILAQTFYKAFLPLLGLQSGLEPIFYESIK